MEMDPYIGFLFGLNTLFLRLNLAPLPAVIWAVGSTVAPGITRPAPVRRTISVEAFSKAFGVPISNQ